MRRIRLPFFNGIKNFILSALVKNGNVVCLLVDADIPCAIHSLLKKLNKLIVYFVNIFSDFF